MRWGNVIAKIIPVLDIEAKISVAKKVNFDILSVCYFKCRNES